VILEVSNLHVAAGQMIRLQKLDLALGAGDCLALLGPNGAGKTASVEATVGLIPKSGRVVFDGEDISALPASAVVRRGLTLVPQLRDLFPGFTVQETLLAGGNALGDRPSVSASQIYELFPRLKERRHQFAGSLSGGEQQMLAIGRALMSNPKLMLLDEPSAGEEIRKAYFSLTLTVLPVLNLPLREMERRKQVRKKFIVEANVLHK
jgi:branched-chain amino acid transport system ATP-binding protein